MNANVKVSVILPTYNRLATLPRALDSVLSQTFSDWDLWIIDDGSSDGTAEWVHSQLKEFIAKKKIHYLYGPNRGVSYARNKGIQASSGSWLAFLDSDDQWLSCKLELQWQLADRQPPVALIHGEEIWVRNGVRVNPMKKHQKSGGRIFKNCIPLCCVSPSTALVRRSVLQEVGFFREDFPVCEDYELWLRICARYEVGFISDPVITKYGGHADQLSKKYVAMDYWRVLALEPFMNSPHLSYDERKLVRETIEEKSQILLRGYRKHNNLVQFKTVENLYHRVKTNQDFLPDPE